jgi:hypothetical protein
MKLRQLKRKHVGRLRRRMRMARMAALLNEFEVAMAGVANALVDFILAPRRMVEAFAGAWLNAPAGSIVSGVVSIEPEGLHISGGAIGALRKW